MVKIGRSYPSSKTCPCCDHKVDVLPLTIRSWTCTVCEPHHDKGTNAAINIQKQGLLKLKAEGFTVSARRGKRKFNPVSGLVAAVEAGSSCLKAWGRITLIKWRNKMKKNNDNKLSLKLENKIAIVVPVSGGKDSQACLKLALENYHKNEVIGLFCDTGFEHPLTYRHIDAMSEKYDVYIEKLSNNGNVESKCLKYNRFPSGTARFCTDQLKIQPSKKFYKLLSSENGGFEVWYGVRSAESHQRAKRYAGKIASEVYPISEYMKIYP
ncbi:MAG: phosphoadenosine phosphosulfate reductase family protein, partial [Tissierellia bacterium]|nr:phosphoadenosine phosphosulfate reductase family protein [Tissierellia bacterium]